jgi:hypothetical protein
MNLFDFIEPQEDKTLATIQELKSLSLEEYTLKIKWYEIQRHINEIMPFLRSKYKISNPKTIEEIKNLKIRILPVNDSDEELYRIYKNFMLFTSSALQNNYPGRKLSFLVENSNDGKFLGMITIAGDIGALSARDNFIGWSKDHKYKNKRINNLMNAQVLVPLQPFGYNCLGGKLLARIVVTDYFRNAWKEKYGDMVVGVTTTSLYGSFCQYTGIKFWQNLGTTSGKVPIELPEIVLNDWKIKYPAPVKKDDDVNPNRYKDELMRNICKDLGIDYKTIYHGIQRGVHYVSLYENSNDFLQCKIEESQLKPIQELKDLEKQIEQWKVSAIKRFTKLQSENRLIAKSVYYDDAAHLTFEETKKRFLSGVNR